MKRFLVAFFALFLLLVIVVQGFAGTFDKKCAICHKPDNKPAPSKESLLKKFKNAEALIKAAKTTTNPMMKAVQDNEQLLRNAAQDIGLK